MTKFKFPMLLAAAITGSVVVPAFAAKQPTWTEYVHGGDVMMQHKQTANAQRYYAAALSMLARTPRPDPRVGTEMWRAPLNSLLYGYLGTCPMPVVADGQKAQLSEKDLFSLKQRIAVNRQIATTYSAMFGSTARPSVAAATQLAKAQKLYEEATSPKQPG